MAETKNILIAGVGGQGAILASNILSLAALEAGFDAKKSEIHGMSQRGGSVFSHIRFGSKVHSPVIPRGAVHVFLSLELMESLRWLDHLGPESRLVISSTRILPAMVQTYPEGIEAALRKTWPDLELADAEELVRKTGHQKYLNIALTGIVSRHLPEIGMEHWQTALEAEVPAGTFAENWQAFNTGREA